MTDKNGHTSTHSTATTELSEPVIISVPNGRRHSVGLFTPRPERQNMHADATRQDGRRNWTRTDGQRRERNHPYTHPIIHPRMDEHLAINIQIRVRRGRRTFHSSLSMHCIAVSSSQKCLKTRILLLPHADAAEVGCQCQLWVVLPPPTAT